MLVNTYKFPDFPKDKINEFLAKANNQLIYYSIEYNEFCFEHFPTEIATACISHENKITGLLWFHIYENDTGVKIANSLPFFGGHGGAIVLPNSEYKKNYEEQLAAKFLDICKKNNVASCLVVENLYSANGDLFRVQHGFEQVEKRIGQITVLPNGSTNSDIEEALLSKFHVKTRNAIRKGMNFNQDIALDKSTEAWEWLGSAHWNSIVALGGVPKSRHIFDIRASKIKHRLYVGRNEGISVQQY